MKAPLHPREDARMAALRRYQVLDTQPEREFDDIVKLASYICGVPISAISLIDEARQWFKASVGLDVPETHRDDAFCAHTILDVKPLVVSDARTDGRFYDNPYVLAEPHIRFYAGCPLIGQEGLPLGSLCVIDSETRELTPVQMEMLQALARQVVVVLELRRVSAELAALGNP